MQSHATGQNQHGNRCLDAAPLPLSFELRDCFTHTISGGFLDGGTVNGCIHERAFGHGAPGVLPEFIDSLQTGAAHEVWTSCEGREWDLEEIETMQQPAGSPVTLFPIDLQLQAFLETVT